MMTREEQIIEASTSPISETGLIRIDDISFIEGAKWADKTILQEVLKWLKENFYNVHVLHDDRLEGDFNNKEQMLQSFKERFNIK